MKVDEVLLESIRAAWTTARESTTQDATGVLRYRALEKKGRMAMQVRCRGLRGRAWHAIAVLIAIVAATAANAQGQGHVLERALRSAVTVYTFDGAGLLLGRGSGFVVEPSRVVTNAHVIAGAEYVEVCSEASGHVVCVDALYASHYDVDSDLAVLVTPFNVGPMLPLSGDAPSIGDDVVVVSSPHGLHGTVSYGYVSAVRTFEGVPYVQFTASIAPGSSGGPVLNETGAVVAVVVSAIEDFGSYNFAVPVALLRNLLGRRPSPLHFWDLVEAFPSPGCSGVEAVSAGAFEFESLGGGYSFSVWNHGRATLRHVDVLLVFFDGVGTGIHSEVVSATSDVLPGLATRVTGRVHSSVRSLVADVELRVCTVDTAPR